MLAGVDGSWSPTPSGSATGSPSLAYAMTNLIIFNVAPNSLYDSLILEASVQTSLCLFVSQVGLDLGVSWQMGPVM